ncbi:MAG: TIGR02444 family protein [Alphaproteobacteria bacterium]|nr:TIGR02444 family protein [Alphaproteobacteria bacterium]
MRAATAESRSPCSVRISIRRRSSSARSIGSCRSLRADDSKDQVEQRLSRVSDKAARAFWRFSLALYRRPGVAAACERLQDRLGCDVNVLLFCLWLGATGRSLDRAQFARTLAAASPWQQTVLRPLRQARRALKELAVDQALYQRVKRVELAMERSEQIALAQTAPHRSAGAPDRARAIRYLRYYWAWAGLPRTGARRPLAGLVAATFPTSRKNLALLLTDL